MKITKEKIRKFVSGVRNTKENMGWCLWQAGAYIKDDEISLYSAYHGQSIDETIYNSTYEELILFTDVIDNEVEYTQKEAINILYEEIQDMIEEYNKDLFDTVLTFKEASEKFGVAASTLRHRQRDGRFEEGDTRKSGNTWLVTVEAMKRLYGDPLDLYDKINDLLIQSGYETEWDVDQFITRKEIEEGEGDKDKIYDANELISKNGFDIAEFNKKFGYTY